MQGPILYALREGGSPIGPVQIGQWGFWYVRDAALKGEDARSIPVKNEEVLNAIAIEVCRGKLGCGEAAYPWVVQGGAVEAEYRDGVPSAQFREALPCCGRGDAQSEQEDWKETGAHQP